jgi:6-phosphogluconolactonase
MISLRRIPRCGLLLLAVLALTMMNVPQVQAADSNNFLVYVGTYANRGGKGIYAYRFNSKTGRFTDLGLAAETADPSFLTTSRDGKFLYAVNEISSYQGKPGGLVSSFAIQANTGKLKALNTVSSRGPGPAHIIVDRSGKSVLIANYDEGNIAVLPILENGGLGEASAFVQHKGSSVDPERQKGPHAHCIVMSPDGRFAIVADLGLDELIVYPFNPIKRTLGSAPHNVKVHPGSGPRHLAFSPNGKFLYLITEMKPSLVAYAYSAAHGGLQELQTVSTLPQGFTGASDGAEVEIDPSGRFLYASNRGADSIAVFAIDSAKGTLTSVGFTLTQGKTPRHFAIDPTGRWLFAENQESDDIVIFKIDEKTGQLTQHGDLLHVPSPVCVKFVPVP